MATPVFHIACRGERALSSPLFSRRLRVAGPVSRVNNANMS